MVGRTHAVTLTAILATAGCATSPQRAAWVETRPLEVSAGRQVSASDGYYAGAVAAIDRRDYAAALELLQLARAHAPGDVRVFNAFGVIYDKLGRFDLSARYYAQAAALEPSSPIVAANVAYSAVLERRIAQPLEGVRLARVEGDLKPMARPDLTAEAPPLPHRIVETPRPLSVADTTAPARVDGVRRWPTSTALRRMPASDLSEPHSEPTRATLAPTLAAAPSAPGGTVRLLPAIVDAPLRAPAPPQHVLHAIVSAAGPSLASAIPVRIDAAGRPASGSPRAMMQPNFAAPAGPPASTSPPMRIVLTSTPAQAPPQTTGAPARGAPVTRLRAASSPVVKLAATAAPPRRLPLLTGSTLLVINASGRRAGGDPVATRLAHLGWSLPRSTQTAPVQRQTSIVYPARNATVARALARTLPYKVRLVTCVGRCDRMRLVVGTDALAWRKGARAGSMVKVKIA
jgi:hypothetical protein